MPAETVSPGKVAIQVDQDDSVLASFPLAEQRLRSDEVDHKAYASEASNPSSIREQYHVITGGLREEEE